MRSIRIFAKNMGDPYYEPTIVVHDEHNIVVHDEHNSKFQFCPKYTYCFLFT